MPKGATHLLLYVECGRGEGGMLFSLNLTVAEAIAQIAERYGYDLHNGDVYDLFWGRERLDKAQRLHQTGVPPNSIVRLSNTEPKV